MQKMYAKMHKYDQPQLKMCVRVHLHFQKGTLVDMDECKPETMVIGICPNYIYLCTQTLDPTTPKQHMA